MTYFLVIAFVPTEFSGLNKKENCHWKRQWLVSLKYTHHHHHLLSSSCVLGKGMKTFNFYHSVFKQYLSRYYHDTHFTGLKPRLRKIVSVTWNHNHSKWQKRIWTSVVGVRTGSINVKEKLFWWKKAYRLPIPKSLAILYPHLEWPDWFSCANDCITTSLRREAPYGLNSSLLSR